MQVSYGTLTELLPLLEAGDKLRVPVNSLATLLSPRSTPRRLNISRKSLFEEEVSASVSVFVLFFFFVSRHSQLKTDRKKDFYC